MESERDYFTLKNVIKRIIKLNNDPEDKWSISLENVIYEEELQLNKVGSKIKTQMNTLFKFIQKKNLVEKKKVIYWKESFTKIIDNYDESECESLLFDIDDEIIRIKHGNIRSSLGNEADDQFDSNLENLREEFQTNPRTEESTSIEDRISNLAITDSLPQEITLIKLAADYDRLKEMNVDQKKTLERLVDMIDDMKQINDDQKKINDVQNEKIENMKQINDDQNEKIENQSKRIENQSERITKLERYKEGHQKYVQALFIRQTMEKFRKKLFWQYNIQNFEGLKPTDIYAKFLIDKIDIINELNKIQSFCDQLSEFIHLKFGVDSFVIKPFISNWEKVSLKYYVDQEVDYQINELGFKKVAELFKYLNENFDEIEFEF